MITKTEMGSTHYKDSVVYSEIKKWSFLCELGTLVTMTITTGPRIQVVELPVLFEL